MKSRAAQILLSILTLVVGVGGVFLFEGTMVLERTQAHIGDYIQSHTQTAYAQDPENDVWSWALSIIRSQQQEIADLRQENQDLRRVLGTLSPEYQDTFTGDSTDKHRILLVAGHTADTQGTVYRTLTEYELNYQMMNLLATRLRSAGYEVVTTHQGDDYNETFTQYFEEHKEEILDFRQAQRDAYAEEYPLGVVTNDTDHNYASTLGVLQLYGVNHWANNHDIDAVLHIHFNDYPGRGNDNVGEHTGFSLFTSLKTNDNFVESFRLAKQIERHMLDYADRSTVLRESAGVLESELIAVGQANSVDAPAVLLELGFIYENKFVNPVSRQAHFDDYARAITNAVGNYFAAN